MTESQVSSRSAFPFMRVAGVGLLASLVLLFAVSNIISVTHPRGTFGFSYNYDFMITAIVPSGPADEAGVRVGDRFDQRRLIADGRHFDPIIDYLPEPGTRVSLPIIRGSRHFIVQIVAQPPAESAFDTFTVYLSAIIYFVGALIGAWLVMRRPSLLTWAFYLMLVGIAPTSGDLFASWGYWWMLAAAIVATLSGALSIAGLIVFALRLPNDESPGWRGWILRSVPLLFAATSVLWVYPTIASSVFAIPTEKITDWGPDWGFLTGVFALAVLLGTYFRARGQDRERVKWVIFGMTVGVGAVLVSIALSSIGIPGYKLIWLNTMLWLLSDAAIVSVAYALVRNRVIDVTFVISRALVLGIFTAVVVALFAVIDWFFTKRLVAAGIGTFMEISAAIALGFWLNGLHRRVDSVVERVFFRQRAEAELRMARAAEAVPHAESVEVVEKFIVAEPYAAYGLTSAALFQKIGAGGYSRTHAIGWGEGTATELQPHDELVLHLKAEHGPLKINEIRWPNSALPSDTASPVLAVPILVRRQVVAIALYGAHSSGADLDPDEIRAIAQLSHAAAAAFDHIEAESIKREVESIRRENELLRTQLAAL